MNSTTATWNGMFRSSQYGAFFVNGTMELLLPDDLSHPFDGIGSVAYNGIYRFGYRGDVPFHSSVTETGQLIIEAKQGSAQHLVFDPQTIDLDHGKIFGTYTSMIPQDFGTFELTRVQDGPAGDYDIESADPMGCCLL